MAFCCVHKSRAAQASLRTPGNSLPCLSSYLQEISHKGEKNNNFSLSYHQLSPLSLCVTLLQLPPIFPDETKHKSAAQNLLLTGGRKRKFNTVVLCPRLCWCSEPSAALSQGCRRGWHIYLHVSVQASCSNSSETVLSCRSPATPSLST